MERRLWQLSGVTNTAVGYSGGHTLNPTYKDVCSGTTDHVEVVKVTYLDSPETLMNILISFWEMHDPTQGMRQGNDIGTQYRSVIFYKNESQLDILNDSLRKYQNILTEKGLQTITTTIERAQTFFFSRGLSPTIFT